MTTGTLLATLPPQADEAGLTGHAVIVGYGRVGSVVGSGLRSQGLAVVVVEQNRCAVEELRNRGRSFSARAFTTMQADPSDPRRQPAPRRSCGRTVSPTSGPVG